MDPQKKQTLDQVNAAIDAVEKARADKSLTPIQKHQLEDAFTKLREAEISLIQLQQQELIDTLTQDAQALQALSLTIAQSAGKLSDIANIMAKVANVIQTLVNAVTAGLASGLTSGLL